MTYDDIINRVKVEFPGCPDVTIENHLKRSVRQFLRETGLWSVEVEVVVPAGSTEVILPLNGSLVSIRSVEPSGVKWSYVSGSTLEIQPLDFDETLTVVAAITIFMTDTDIPEACYPYEDGIAHGAMRTIAMISHSPWFNAALAEYHNTEFTKEIRRGKMQYARGHYSNPQYIQIPRF